MWVRLSCAFVSLLLVDSSPFVRLSSLVGHFFVSVTPSYVSVLLCFCVLEGPSLSDSFGSKVSLSDGVAQWDESVILPFAPSFSPGVSSGLCQLLPGFPPCFCLGFSLLDTPFLSLSECGLRVLSSPSSSSMASCSSLLGSVIGCVCSAFSSRSVVLVYFIGFILPVLFSSPGFLCGVVTGSFLSLRVLPFGSLFLLLVILPRMVSSGSVLAALVAVLYSCALLLSCASALYCSSFIWVSLYLPFPCGSSLRFLSFYAFSGVFLCPFSSLPPPS